MLETACGSAGGVYLPGGDVGGVAGLGYFKSEPGSTSAPGKWAADMISAM